MNLVMPMAGRGKRFEMYDKPKLLVEVNGTPMIEVVLKNIRSNLRGNVNPIYIFNKKMDNKYGFSKMATKILDGEVILLDEYTTGAACTVLEAKDSINNMEGLCTANVDQLVLYSFLMDYFTNCPSGDGVILAYRSSEPYHSFVEVVDGTVTRTAEKKAISDIATVGIYHWTRGRDFVESAEDMIAKNIRYKDEFYLCPVYNQGIERGKKYEVYLVPKRAVHIIGTPQTLEAYEANST